MPHLSRRAWLAVLVAIAGLGAAGVAIAGAQGDDTPRGTDPLSDTEEQAALDLARGSGDAESDGLGDDDVVLRVERHEDEKDDGAEGGSRRADVYVYSYDDDTLILTVVDLATGEVDSTEDLTEWGAPPPELVVSHANLYWQFQDGPGRTATVESSDEVDLAGV